MSPHSVSAEYHRLDSVRVHLPGLETFVGIVDPVPNLFRSDFSLKAAQAEHDRLVSVLEDEVGNVRYLHDDLAAEDSYTELIDAVKVNLVDVDQSRRQTVINDIRDQLRSLSPFEKLQIISSNMGITRAGNDTKVPDDFSLKLDKGRLDSTSVRFERPLSNLYFQRDQQLVTAKGPVMASPAYATRAAEVDLCQKAWEAIGAEIVYDTPADYKIEGGDYIPAGEFALLGVYEERGTEGGLRTSFETAQHLLKMDVFGHEELALVRAPYNVDRRIQAERGTKGESGMDIMHLDTWFNIAADGIAVARKPLVEHASVEVYVSNGDGYDHHNTRNFADYLYEKGYRIIPVPFEEREIGTNFLTLDSGTVLAPHYTDDNGEYDPDQNVTLQRMDDAGIEIIPDGQGLAISELRSGYGGVHCMTTPLNRRS